MPTTYADDNERRLMASGAAWLQDNLPQQRVQSKRGTLSGPDGKVMSPPDAAGQMALARNAQEVARGGAARGLVSGQGDRAVDIEQRALAVERQNSGLRQQGDAYGPGAHNPDGSGGAVSVSSGYSADLARKNAETSADSLRFDARLASGQRQKELLDQAQVTEAAPRAEQLARAGLENQVQLGAIRERDAIDLSNIQGSTARDVARLNADSRVDAAEARAEAQRIALSVRGAGSRAPTGYDWNDDGTLRAISGGPADPKSKANEPLNEGQSKALGFGTRMLQSGKMIDDLAAAGVSAPSFSQQLTGGRGALGMAANAISSPAQQQVAQAQRDFINSVLRRESGAVVTDDEFENAARQYFVQPGDSKEVIAQKRKNRETSTRAILADVPNADGRVRGILGDGYSLAAPDGAQQEPPAVAELRRRAVNNPQLAERLRQLGY